MYKLFQNIMVGRKNHKSSDRVMNFNLFHAEIYVRI